MEGDFVFASVKESHPLHFLASVFLSAIHTLFCFVFRLTRPPKHVHSVNCSSSDLHQQASNWRVKTSLFLLHVMLMIRKPVVILGSAVEYYLNVISANGGLRKTLMRALFHHGDLVIPRLEDSKSFVGQLDSRWDIPMNTKPQLQEVADSSDASESGFDTFPSIWAAQVCVMASKLVYENKHFVKKVVEERWKMHFVNFYDCWNEYLSYAGTQAFLFMDKEEDANAVVVAFRGTSPFELYDWCTDVDFSWYALPHMGKVHVGFLEALGLCNRLKRESFERMKNIGAKKAQRETRSSAPTSGLSDEVLKDPKKVLAYDAICSQVRYLLKTNPRARFYVTGHSLGGALSAMMGALLLREQDDVILPRLQGIITFGQPRVGDEQFARFMRDHLCKPDGRKYVRVIYGFDMPGRIPSDDPVFNFKHIGDCHYYGSRFEAQIMEEAPDKNYFSLLLYPSTYVTCAWELVQSVVLRYYAGDENGETWLSIFLRVAGFFIPGLCAHNPANYVNGVVMGPSTLWETSANETKESEGGIFHTLKQLYLQLREAKSKGKQMKAEGRERKEA